MDYNRLMSDRLESWPQAMFKVPLAGHASLSATFRFDRSYLHIQVRSREPWLSFTHEGFREPPKVWSRHDLHRLRADYMRFASVTAYGGYILVHAKIGLYPNPRAFAGRDRV
jgi:hypothetical protein